MVKKTPTSIEIIADKSADALICLRKLKNMNKIFGYLLPSMMVKTGFCLPLRRHVFHHYNDLCYLDTTRNLTKAKLFILPGVPAYSHINGAAPVFALDGNLVYSGELKANLFLGKKKRR